MTSLLPSTPTVEGLRAARSLLTIRVARMHYLEHMSNTAIAETLKISRFRVARLLDYALESGIVQIAVTAPINTDDELSEAIRRNYDIVEAVVLPTGHALGRDGQRLAVGRLAALYLAELATERSKIGISWGRTLIDVAVGLGAQRRFPRCDVLQLVGNVPTREGATHATDVLRGFADTARGEVYPLHAPLVLPDAATAAGVRSEASVSRVLALVPQLDIAVVGIGSWQPPSSRLIEVLLEGDVAGLRPFHPVADVCANVYDANGEPITGDFSARTIGATHEQLLALPMVVGVASGAEKADAVKAALRSGILDALVIDGDLGRTLLTD